MNNLSFFGIKQTRSITPTLFTNSQDRNNNLNLLRFIVATLVLFSHSYPLAGFIHDEPLARYCGLSLGELAVDIFFIVSGFLVTSSLITKQNMWLFIKSRTLRIYPALIIMLLITIFGFGVFFTTSPLNQYFGKQTINYFFTNAVAVKTINFYLPGLFVNNPHPAAVNGSLWTLTYELKMYIYLVFVWKIFSVIAKERSTPNLKRFIIFTTCLSALAYIGIKTGVISSSYKEGTRLFFSSALDQPIISLGIKSS